MGSKSLTIKNEEKRGMLRWEGGEVVVLRWREASLQIFPLGVVGVTSQNVAPDLTGCVVHSW